MYIAASAGYDAVVQILLDEGANINAASKLGVQPLHRASQNGHDAVIELLLLNGADCRARTNAGWTAEGIASSRGQNNIAALLQTDADAAASWDDTLGSRHTDTIGVVSCGDDAD
ncbi:ankyrin repeat-containing domain protein [Baffinella frigidus]|nr:ankyrin repeat-containing domain protein [Cryptophyta sp. CCMP2293]